MVTVVIDPGHGGHDPGAVNKRLSLSEEDVVLDLSLRIEKSLESRYSGVKAILTRETDKYLTLKERYQFANKLKADSLVSIHCNSATNLSAHGWEIFTTRGQNRSDRLASYIGTEVGEALPSVRARTDMSDGDLDKEAQFTVIRGTNCPSTLFELDFISNDKSATRMRDEEYLETVADAIADGIAQFHGLTAQLKQPTVEPTVVSDDREVLLSIQNQLNTYLK